MRRLALLLGCAAMLAACGDDDDDGNNPPANTILVEDNEFNPSTLTVPVGATVTFSWPNGSTNHNVVPWASNSDAIPNQPALLQPVESRIERAGMDAQGVAARGLNALRQVVPIGGLLVEHLENDELECPGQHRRRLGAWHAR